MTLSCEQTIDMIALANDLKETIDSIPYGEKIVDGSLERNSTVIDYVVNEDREVTIKRVFVQNQNSIRMANLLTDYFNE